MQISETLVANQFSPNEKVLGICHATYIPSFWWFFLIGPLLFMGMRTYYLGFSEEHVVFVKLDMMGDTLAVDKLSYDEILLLKIKPASLKFTLENERKLRLRISRPQEEPKDKAVLSKATIAFLKTKFPQK